MWATDFLDLGQRFPDLGQQFLDLGQKGILGKKIM
jgi:hypothetical protein